MTKIFNRHEDLTKRRTLRHNMTPPEIILWKQLQRSQIAGAKFRRQYGVLNYVVDFFCPEVRLALELDGSSHDGDDAVAYDAIRQTEIEAAGITFLRFSNRDISPNLNAATQTIANQIEQLRRQNENNSRR